MVTKSAGLDTSVEEVPVSPAVETVSEETPVGAPPPETAEIAATDTVPDLDAEIQKQVDSAIAELTPEAAAPSDGEEKVTLTKTELEEQKRLAAQSAKDKARFEAGEEARKRDEITRQRQTRRTELHRRIGAAAETTLNTDGTIRPDFAETVARDYEADMSQEAAEKVYGDISQAMFQALRGLPVMAHAAQEDWEPMSQNARTDAEALGNMVQVALNAQKRQIEAEVDKRAEKKARDLLPPLVSAGVKKTLLSIQGTQEDKELPKGEGTRKTKLTLGAYWNDMTPEERKQVPKEDVDAMTRAAMGLA